MKKFLAVLMAATIGISMTACASDDYGNDYNNSNYGTNNYDTNDQNEDEDTEPANDVPTYNTFGISVDTLIDKLNDSGKYTTTWAHDYTSSDYENGKSSFELNYTIAGASIEGYYETSTGNIIRIDITSPIDPIYRVNPREETLDTDFLVLTGSATSIIMEQLLGINYESAYSLWSDALTSSVNSWINYSGDGPIKYSNYEIDVNYDYDCTEIYTRISQQKER